LEQDFNSLDAQREACESYARSQSWKVVATYDDGGFTGANIDRPAFQRLLADIEAGKIDIVLVYKVDRLSRSLHDFVRVMERFNSAGAAFVSVTQQFSTADAMGRLTLNMLMSFAEYEREMISDRTRDKIVANRRRGKWTGGAVPIGYYVIDHKLVKNAPEAVVVKEVFELYETHKSVLEVMRELRARGRVRRSRAWSKDAVTRVLRNPIYAGLMSAGGELFAAEHEAIIQRVQFERVQSMLREQSGAPMAAPSRNVMYLLRGLLRCGVCGASMTPGGSRGYRYYRCVTRDKQGKEACAARHLPAEAIESFVVERLRDMAANRSEADILVARMRERFKADAQALSAARAALPARIAKLAADASALLPTLGRLSGRARRLAEERFEAAANALEKAQGELALVEQKLVALKHADADAAWVAEALSDFGVLWDLMTPDNRQRLVSALVERVVVSEKDEDIQIRLSRLSEAA
jgi:DNA invertase Pin-like site-specific DNA recombinase